MIPATVDIIEEEQGELSSPSYTYRINPLTNRIAGMIDGEDALIQAIEKILDVSRYAYVIYDWYYGNEIAALIGKPFEYIKAEVPRLLSEALLQDDRISAVTNVTVTQTKVDALFISCTVQTVYGVLSVESEVTL